MSDKELEKKTEEKVGHDYEIRMALLYTVLGLAVIALLILMAVGKTMEVQAAEMSASDKVRKTQLESVYYGKVNYELPSQEVMETIMLLGQSYNVKEKEEFIQQFDGNKVVRDDIIDEFKENCGYFGTVTLRGEKYEGGDLATVTVSYARGVAFMKVNLMEKTVMYKIYIKDNKIDTVVRYEYIV